MELSSLSSAELRALIADVTKMAKDKEKEEMKAFVAQDRENKAATRKAIQKIADDLGVPLSELIAGSAGRSAKSQRGAKYRDPANVENEWGGMGKRPSWLQNLLNLGANIEDFKVS